MEKLVDDFRKVASITGITLHENAISVEILDAPHTPPTSLPTNKMAIYIFKNESGEYLKVGKVGPRSSARYTSQHYNPKSAKSTLAASLLTHKKELNLSHLDCNNVGEWVKNNTTRTNLLLDADLGPCVLTLLESFLHCRLNPKFEGHQWR